LFRYVEAIARSVIDECAGRKGQFAEDFTGAGQDGGTGAVIQEADVTRIHIDGGNEAGGRRALEMHGKAGPVNIARGGEGQQDGRDARDRTARAKHRKGIDGGHEGMIFTNRSSGSGAVPIG